MAAVIMGISGSPVSQSNTDRAMVEIMERSGLEYEFVKLSEMHLEPCRACLGCVDDNRCIINDNGRVLAERFAKVKGFVIGGYTSYGSLDSRTKMFMERMYCLRHLRGFNRGKIGISVITTASDPKDPDRRSAAEIPRKQFDMWMEEEGITNLGSLVIPGNAPCIRCGHGNQCAMSEAQLRDGLNAAGGIANLLNVKLEPTILTRAAELGIKLRDALQGSGTPVTEHRR